MQDVDAAVRNYYAVVADLQSPVEALLAVLHPGVQVIEHPNAINPRGAQRDLSGVITGYELGKQLLSEQAFDLHDVLTAGNMVAVRATWRGRLAKAVGPMPAGAVLTAHVASFLTVEDGFIRRHETFDCYEPLPV